MDVEVEHRSYPPGFASGWHSHDFAQLIYPSQGVMTIRTRSGTWIVPPLRACWLPASAEHHVEAPFGLEMLSAYCSGPGLDRLPAKSGIVQVSGLLRESILALQNRMRPARQHRAIVVVFAGEVRLLTPTQLHLPTLRSPKLSRIAAAWRRDPADGRTLEEWARELGVAPRTLAREFQKEARITFTQYRTEFRLQAAIERLAANHSVTTVAYDLGFGSPSNFIAMFRKATGVTPAAYFRDTPT
ncbi:MAG TPA: helix-turn-helix transcriptional regulator [Terriglobia bacterium]|nr:helix-turn-helix transcriptional regulator [Terriglobia bacterium]